MKKKDSLKERVSRKLLTIWPLPPPAMRRNSFLPIQLVHKEFRLTRDCDFLVYRALCVSFVINVILFALLYADVFLKTGILIDPALVADHPLSLLVKLRNLLLAPTFLVMLAFYLRLRLPMNLKDDMIPISMLRTTIEQSPRGAWIRWSLFGVVTFLILPIGSHLAVGRFVAYYHGEHSIRIIILMQLIFQVFGTSCVTMGALTSALLLEKSIRFFPQAQDDLRNRAY
ncbi:MAG: hypothetical protein J0H94_21035 [Rhizobiales bacterium]|nr:hypothetical protein [Hyphomicrobiales bacterium]MBN9489977.1 hypothetical protein [Alphaproteobacteria bacterium]